MSQSQAAATLPIAPTYQAPTAAPTAGSSSGLDGVISQLAAVTNQLQAIVDALAVRMSPVGGGPSGIPGGGCGCACHGAGQAAAGAASTIGAPPLGAGDPSASGESPVTVGQTDPGLSSDPGLSPGLGTDLGTDPGSGSMPPLSVGQSDPGSDPAPDPASKVEQTDKEAGTAPAVAEPPKTDLPKPPGDDVGSVDVAKWVNGDVDGLNEDLLNRLAKVGEDLGKTVDIKSGFRSREEQEVLYQKYLNGTGNLAAKPGSSNHESGNAADVNVDGTSLANVEGAKEIAAKHGLGFPVGGEPWHTEIV